MPNRKKPVTNLSQFSIKWLSAKWFFPLQKVRKNKLSYVFYKKTFEAKFT